jgi:hypothetical protein
LSETLSEILLRLAFAIVALGTPTMLARYLHRRYATAYKLLAIGIFTFSGAFFFQTIFFAVLGNPLFDTPFFGALAAGIIIGFTDIGARAFGYHQLARDVVYRPQAIMIGIGHSLPFMVFNAIVSLAIIFGITDQNFDLNTVSEFFATLTRMIAHITLSWIVLQTFLRNELAYLFQAVFFAAIIFGTEALIANAYNDPAVLLILWWSLMSAISLTIFRRLHPPDQFIYRPSAASHPNA